MDNTGLVKQCQQAATIINKFFACDVFENNDDNRVYFSLFSGEDSRWKIEITLPLFDNASRKEDFKKGLIKECLYQLAKENFSLASLGGKVLIKDRSIIYSASSIADCLNPCFSKCKRIVESVSDSVLIINDYPRTGKSLFAMWYLNKKPNSQKVHWLDFNRGNMDFIDSMVDILTVSPATTSFIVLDNLECCGFRNSKVVFNLFKSFVDCFNSLSPTKRLKLFVIQDSTRPIFYSYSEHKGVKMLDHEISKALKQDKDLDKQYTNISYDNVSNAVDAFLDRKDIPISAKALLGKALFFSQNEICLISNESDRDILLCIPGIRVTRNNEIISFSKELSHILLDKHREAFSTVLSDDCFKRLSDNFLDYYNEYWGTVYAEMSIADLRHILKNSDAKSTTTKKLINVLEKAEQGARGIAQKVLDAPNDNIFNNHLGAILFSVEAMSSFSERDWLILHASEKIRDHIRSFYYVNAADGILPKVALPFENKEGTYKDFRSRLPIKGNCIENQIDLQNEFLAKVGFKAKEEISLTEMESLRAGKDSIDDSLFDLYLSPRQESDYEDATNNIDINSFFGTYILAVLFELELNLPRELRDSQRIADLWSIIKCNCIWEHDSRGVMNAAYYYPVRIPWVSARMMLALDSYKKLPEPDHSICEEIDRMIEGLANYLIQCSMCFMVDNMKYRFWAAGTGFWNSALETTILCTFAIQEAAPSIYQSEINEGQRFIELYSNRWFDGKMLADGIWAYRITELSEMTRKRFAAAVSAFSNKTKGIDFTAIPQTEKNDRSLGESHIAKTYIDSVGDLLEVNPTKKELSLNRVIKTNRAKQKNKTIISKEVNMNSSNPTVFVTYAWDETDPGNNYLREVNSFVDKLRKNGYDATYDRRMFAENHNWTEIMNKGLQMDKIIVLLSKNYKIKAEAEERRGVTIEQNALVARFKKDKQSIVFAKLPSQQNYSFDEILPVVFSGEHIIDLSSTDNTDGYNLLYRTLACKSITGDPAPVSSIINEGSEL